MVPGAAGDILATLEAFGLEWDGPVLYQSERSAAYEAALAALAAAGLTYACSCSRSELAGHTRYPGTCRGGPRRPNDRLAVRLRTAGSPPVTVTDRLQPALTESVEATTGDFVLRRRDGYFAYQLAVVVDDALQGITDVVRGLDLYDNTPRQRLLQGALGLPAPRTLHLPLVVDRDGQKLSKSRRPLPLDATGRPRILSDILGWLRHPPPEMLQGAPVREQLAWAVDHWNIQLLHGIGNITLGPA